MTKDKWKIFAMQQCFCGETDDVERVQQFNELFDLNETDDIEKYLFSSNLIPWHPFEFMHVGEFTDFVHSLAAQAQAVEGDQL